VITGELKGKIDRIWDAFWSGGISNPLEVIEQITYLLFFRRLDDLQTLAENRARHTGKPVESPIFRPGQAEMRWSRFKTSSPASCTRSSVKRSFRFCASLAGTVPLTPGI
jgi:type I restriction enzyme M protein